MKIIYSATHTLVIVSNKVNTRSLITLCLRTSEHNEFFSEFQEETLLAQYHSCKKQLLMYTH